MILGAFLVFLGQIIQMFLSQYLMVVVTRHKLANHLYKVL